MWKLFQIAVFFGVFALLHESGQTKDMGMAPLVVAAFTSLLATVVLSAIFDLLRKLKALLFGRHKSVNERLLTRI